MKIIEKSLSIAIRAYAGKLDKAGSEYIKHPLRIMAKMANKVAFIAPLFKSSEMVG